MIISYGICRHPGLRLLVTKVAVGYGALAGGGIHAREEIECVVLHQNIHVNLPKILRSISAALTS
jgi:hypothetical protein